MHSSTIVARAGETSKDTDQVDTRVRTLPILALALLLRLLVLLVVVMQFPRHWFFTRGLEMGLLAKSIVEGHGFASPFGGATGPTAFFAPVYPIFVAAIFRFFGSYTFASALAVILAQVVLTLLTIWFIMRIAVNIFDARVANIAGLFWACSLPLLWLPTIFWETCLSTCVLTGLLLLALDCAVHPTPVRLILAGVCTGFASLVNPALMPTSFLILGWIACRTTRRHRFALLWSLSIALIVIAPWPIRNARIFHAFVPARTNFGFELWMGNRPGSSGYLEEFVFPMFNSHELDAYKTMGEIAYTEKKLATAKDYIRANPATFLHLTTQRIIRFWLGTGTRGGSPFYPLHALLTTLPGFAGLWLLYRKQGMAATSLFLIPFILFPIPYYLTHAEFRFRIVIDPLLTILGAFTASEILRFFHRSQSTSSHPSNRRLLSLSEELT